MARCEHAGRWRHRHPGLPGMVTHVGVVEATAVNRRRRTTAEGCDLSLARVLSDGLGLLRDLACADSLNLPGALHPLHAARLMRRSWVDEVDDVQTRIAAACRELVLELGLEGAAMLPRPGSCIF